MAGYWPSSFLPVYGPRRSQGSCIDQSNYNAWKELETVSATFSGPCRTHIPYKNRKGFFNLILN